MGDYVVLDRIGQGGMGQVYKAEHKVMERLVALKTLPAAATKSQRAIQRFHREVKVAARLSHPNIVTAYDARQDHGVHFLVMEYVEGADLADLVEKQGPLRVKTALDYVIQAARGLQYAHSENVIHRDVKPSNLLLDNNRSIKILDMGLARLNEMVGSHDSSGRETLTGTGQAMGTLDYMPPEQAENTKTVDHRADVYSLGCTLHALLTGCPIYSGETVVAKLLAHRDAPIPSLCAKRPDVPADLDAVFQKMVAKRPEERHGSMTEVIAALEQCTAPHPEQFAQTTEFEGGSPHGTTLPVVKTGEAVDESLPLELPVVSPIDDFLRAHPKPDRRRQLIMGSAAAAALFVVVLLGVILSVRTPDGAQPPLPQAGDGTQERPLPNGWTFGEPVNLGPTVNSIHSECSPALSADGLTLLFHSDPDRPGGQGRSDLWMCKRESVSDPFGEPVNLGPTVNSIAGEGGPALSADGLTLLFHSNRPGGQGGHDLWMCTRESVSEPFGQPINLGAAVNSSTDDEDPALSADGLTLVFDSHRPGGQGGWDMWMCTRESASDPFGEPVNLGPAVNSIFGEGAPALSADGLALLFNSSRPGGQGRIDVWMVRINPRGAATAPTLGPTETPAALPNGWSFGEPVNLGPTVNSGNFERGSALSADALTLVFSSNRPGGQGTWDLWMCTRKSVSDPFGQPVNLGRNVNSAVVDLDPALSADGLTLLFSSNRPGGQGEADLWMCTRKSVSDPFGQPVNLGPTVNSTFGERGPALSADRLTLLFASNRGGGQGIWMCTRKSVSDPFGEPAKLRGTVNTLFGEGGPELSADCLTLLFHSIRPGGQGDQDLWMCTRKSASDPFGEPVNFGPTVNSAVSDHHPALSADGLTLLFTSMRPGGQGGQDLWMVRIRLPGGAAGRNSGGD